MEVCVSGIHPILRGEHTEAARQTTCGQVGHNILILRDKDTGVQKRPSRGQVTRY